MAFIPVPSTVSATLQYQWDGQQVVNVLHYVKASPWDLDTMGELGAGLVDWWDTTMQALFPDVITLEGIRIVNLQTETAEVLEYSTGLPLSGGSEDDALPNNVALCVTKRTALRGRSYRGRIYHPCLRAVSVTGSTISPSSGGFIANGYENAIVIDLPVAVDEALMVVVSYVSEGVPRAEGVATNVTHMTFDTTVDSQRRRLPGRGN